MKSESEVAQLCLTLRDPMAYQAPPSMGFARQEYWSGLPFLDTLLLHNPCKDLTRPTPIIYILR